MGRLLETVKKAIGRDYTDSLDTMLEIEIQAALEDLSMAGIIDATPETTSAAVIQAVCTYCSAHFAETDEYENLKKWYDEQKAQLQMSVLHTNYEAYGIKTWVDAHGGACGCK